MTRTFDEGVAGGALGLVLAGLGNGIVALTPLAAACPESAPNIAAVLTLILACLGAAAGVGTVRLTTRRADPAPAADGDRPVAEPDRAGQRTSSRGRELPVGRGGC